MYENKVINTILHQSNNQSLKHRTNPVVRQDVHGVGALDGFVRQIPQSSAGDDSGIVDEDVHVADFLLDLLGHLVHLLPIGDVHQIGVAEETLGFQFVGGASQCCVKINEQTNAASQLVELSHLAGGRTKGSLEHTDGPFAYGKFARRTFIFQWKVTQQQREGVVVFV